MDKVFETIYNQGQIHNPLFRIKQCTGRGLQFLFTMRFLVVLAKLSFFCMCITNNHASFHLWSNIKKSQNIMSMIADKTLMLKK